METKQTTTGFRSARAWAQQVSQQQIYFSLAGRFQLSRPTVPTLTIARRQNWIAPSNYARRKRISSSRLWHASSMFALVATDSQMTSECDNAACGAIVGSVPLIAFFAKAWELRFGNAEPVAENSVRFRLNEKASELNPV